MKQPLSRFSKSIGRHKYSGLIIAGVATGVIVGASFGIADATSSGSQQDAVEQAFIQGQVLQENLGALPPQGVTSSTWAMDSDPLVGSPGSYSLQEPGQGWLDSSGAFDVLTPTSSSANLSQQTAEFQSAFAPGALQSRLISALNGQVQSETTAETNAENAATSNSTTGAATVATQLSGMLLPGPGGASAVDWYSVDVSGTTATVNALVQIWNSNYQIASSATGGYSETPKVAEGEADVYATLAQDSAGNWQIVTLDQEPPSSSGGADGASG